MLLPPSPPLLPDAAHPYRTVAQDTRGGRRRVSSAAQEGEEKTGGEKLAAVNMIKWHSHHR